MGRENRVALPERPRRACSAQRGKKPVVSGHERACEMVEEGGPEEESLRREGVEDVRRLGSIVPDMSEGGGLKEARLYDKKSSKAES